MKERYKKMMNELGFESSADKADEMSNEEMIKECEYQLEKYYSEGDSHYDLKHDEPKMWKSETDKLKRFIKRYNKSKK